MTSAAYGPSAGAYVGAWDTWTLGACPGTLFVDGGTVSCATTPFYNPAGERVHS